MLTLYSGPLSLFSAKVRVALAEKSVPHERIDVGWSRRDRYLPHHPEVVRIHPQAKVPCLVHDGLEIWDSTVILEYLEDRFPEPPLMPRDARARARCRQVEHLADEVLFPPVWDLIEARFYPSAGDAASSARVDAALAALDAGWQRLEGSLGDDPWFAGAHFGSGDIGAVITTFYALSLGAKLPASCSSLAGWLERAAARASVSAEIAAMSAAAQAARDDEA